MLTLLLWYCFFLIISLGGLIISWMLIAMTFGGAHIMPLWRAFIMS